MGNGLMRVNPNFRKVVRELKEEGGREAKLTDSDVTDAIASYLKKRRVSW